MPRGSNLDAVRPKGRKKGQVNRYTAGVKAAIEKAFSELSDGNPDRYLLKLSVSEPAVFCTLVGKILPKQAELTVKSDIKVNLVKYDRTDDSS